MPVLTRIAIVTSPLHVNGRCFIRGAAHYLQESRLPAELGILSNHEPLLPAQLEEYDGFVDMGSDRRLAQVAGRKPIVVIDDPFSKIADVSLPMENLEIGRAAARALHDLSPVSYGYFDGTRGKGRKLDWRSAERWKGFRETLYSLASKRIVRKFEDDPALPDACGEWLEAMPKPIGIFCYNDLGSLKIASVCRSLGLDIPNDVAIVGVDNAELICQLGLPPFSSVDPQYERLAALALHTVFSCIENGKFSGEAPPIPVPRLVSRESTGNSSVPDELVRRAQSLLKERKPGPRAQPAEIAKKLGLGLRALDARFKTHLGRSIHEEAFNGQLYEVKRLLRTTDLTLEEISERFHADLSSMRRRFLRAEGIQPGEYRKYHRDGSSKGGVRKFLKSPGFNFCLITNFRGQSAYDIAMGALDFAKERKDVFLSVRTGDSYNVEGDALPAYRDDFSHFDGFVVMPRLGIHGLIPGDRPVVCLEHEVAGNHVRSIAIDNFGAGVLAARHLLGKGHRRFLYCDFQHQAAVSEGAEIDHRSSERYRGFQEALSAAGITNEVEIRSIGGKDDSIPAWLLELERPVAIFAFNDGAALQLANHCRHLGYPVPDEVSILGCDNDVVLCRLTEVELSSIDVNFRRIGYEAVRLLVEEPLDHEKRAKILPAKYVVECASSRGIATTDASLRKAHGMISGSYSRVLDVNAIAAESGASRLTLEGRFHTFFGQGIAGYLQEFRMEKARQLLCDTTLTVGEISEHAGFRDTNYFIKVFKTMHRMTPRDFRILKSRVADR
ncbi:substrate-binding domain-containing protein [Luteolibacter algae]|uniref:Substrate-binding domain-containing protein n=1 Tax=Luteolibacter algae TaxID=454151 RepID=A0ABW5D5K1_9BACT